MRKAYAHAQTQKARTRAHAYRTDTLKTAIKQENRNIIEEKSDGFGERISDKPSLSIIRLFVLVCAFWRGLVVAERSDATCIKTSTRLTPILRKTKAEIHQKNKPKK